MPLRRLLEPLGALFSHLEYKVDRLRLAKLMRRGLRVGRNVYIMQGVGFDFTYPYLIEIGDGCRISRGVRILAHDATTFGELGMTRIAPVRILEGTFIGERAQILPGVTLGPRAVIAAGSMVNRDLGEGVVAAGNPARPYCKHADLLKRYGKMARTRRVYTTEEFESGARTEEDLVRAVKEDGVVFMRGIPSSDPFYVNADPEAMHAMALEAHDRLMAMALPEEGEPTPSWYQSA